MSTAYATLEVIPTVRGITGSLERQIERPFATIGKRVGRETGSSITTGIESAGWESTGRTAGNRVGAGLKTTSAKAGREAGAAITTGIRSADYASAGRDAAGRFRAGFLVGSAKTGRDAGAAVSAGAREESYESSGRSAADRWRGGFTTGMRGIGTGLTLATKGLSLFVVNAGTIATTMGIASRVVRSFSAATFVSAVALRSVASTGLTRLAGALRIIAAIASRVAGEIGQITAAFLLLQAVTKVVSGLTAFGRTLAKATVGAAAFLGVASGVTTLLGGGLASALSVAGPALAGFAASAAGIAGPAIIALKIGMKGLADGAAEFNSKFADADEAMNKLVGQRMGPMLEAFHTMRSEMVDRFSAELTPAFSAVGVAIDRVRGNFGWMSVILGQIGQDMGKAFASDEVVYGIDSMGLASKKFFQQFNKDQSGIAELTKGIFAYLGTAADTFANYGQGLNQVFYNFGKSLQDTDVDQITGAFSGFKQVLSNVGNVVGPLFIAFRQLGAISAKAMAPGFVAIGQAIRDATPGLLNMARVIMPAIGEVMQRLAPLIPALVQAFTPWATVLATIGPPLATVVAHMAPLAPYLLMAATAFRVAGAAMLLWNAATFAGSVAQGVFAAATGRSAATLAGNTIALTAHRIALIAGAVAARAFGAAMAFATGPIGLTIAAVAAIGVALWAFFTKTETGKKLWEKIWPAIKTAVQVAWQYIRVAWDGILAGLGWIGDKATWLWGAMQPVFQAIGSLISWWWTSIVQPAFSGMMTALGWLGTAISWWWQNIVTPAFTAVSNIISWWWSNIVGPAFTAAKAAFGFLGDAISWWWTSIVQPAFSAAGAVLSWFWNDIGSPIFNNFKAIIGLVGDAISWWWNSIAVPAFQAVGAVMSWLWDNVGSPVFDNLKSGVGLVGEAFSFFKDNVVDPVFDGIGTAISFAWDNVVSPVFDKLKSGVGLVGDAFGAAGGVIKTMWSGVADTLRPAVHALGNILAGVPDSIGPIEIPGAGTAKALGQKLQSFNTGGLAVGPGTGTSDSILAAISNGEFIVRARYAKQYLPLLEAINNGLPLPAYAGGGLVDVQNWLRGEAGKPYQYGGTGNPSWDCSGIAGGVWGKVTGKSPNARYFTTDSDFAALGWKSGAGGATDLTIGTNGGSGTGGHMSGRLGDLKFESSGSDGVEVGAGAQDPSSFAQQWHWPVGGNPTTGGLTTGGGTGGSGGTTGGLGSGGASGGASGDASSAGASTSRPSGTAVPVWVDNWPSNLGGASASTSADTSTTTSSGGGTTTTTSDSTDTAYDQASAVNTALSKFSTAMTSAGNTALSGQKSAIPGVGGYVEDIEKTVNNWNIVVADVYEAVSAFSREQKRQTAGK